MKDRNIREVAPGRQAIILKLDIYSVNSLDLCVDMGKSLHRSYRT